MGMTPKEMTDALYAKHPVLKDLLKSNVGLTLQNQAPPHDRCP
jgi:hypothetical protein